VGRTSILTCFEVSGSQEELAGRALKSPDGVNSLTGRKGTSGAHAAGNRLEHNVMSDSMDLLEKEKDMKTAFAMVMALAVVTLFGCQISPRGGSAAKDEGFRIVVPKMTAQVKQGEIQTVDLSVLRDPLFKQDVKLQIKATKGISIEPTSATVKASGKPEVQLQITASKTAALGEYPVVVRGIPDKGDPTSVEFTVKVVAP